MSTPMPDSYLGLHKEYRANQPSVSALYRDTPMLRLAYRLLLSYAGAGAGVRRLPPPSRL